MDHPITQTLIHQVTKPPMAEHVYEGMFILDSNRYGRDPGGVATQIPAMIHECGGKLLASRLWEERRLAYPINGHKKGTYWLTYFSMDSQKVTALNRQTHLNELIVRALFLKIDPRIAETLVTHALTGGPKTAAPETKPATVPAAILAVLEEVPDIDALEEVEGE